MSAFIRGLREKLGHELLHLVGISAVVFNDRDEILLVKGLEVPTWMPIGGMTEVGEEPADTAVREVMEETGVAVGVEKLLGVFDGPRVTYRNGDQAHFVTLIFRCRAISGKPRADQDETVEVRYFSANQLPEMRADHRRNVELALKNAAAAAYLGG